MLNDREKQVLDIIRMKDKRGEARYLKDLRREFRKVGISMASAYKIVERVQRNGSAWRIGVNQIEGYRRSSDLLNKHLKFSE